MIQPTRLRRVANHGRSTNKMPDIDLLLVVPGVIVGMGIAHAIGSLAKLVTNLHRNSIFYSGILISWTILIFAFFSLHWWSIYSVRDTLALSFGSFIFFSALPVVQYIAASVLLPDPASEKEVNPESHYIARSRAFFAIMSLIPLIDILGQYFFYHCSTPFAGYMLIKYISGLLLIIPVFIQSRWIDITMPMLAVCFLIALSIT